MPVRSNIQAYRRALREAGADTQKVIRQALPMIARDVRDTIRKRIPPGSSSGSGMSSRFPGYAATGALKNSIAAGPVRGTKTNFSCSVGLAANANRLTQIKARVHEYGMVIHARNAPRLVFQVQGRWVAVPRVRIRAKRFFRSGWAEAQRKFPELLGTYIQQRWPPRTRSA